MKKDWIIGTISVVVAGSLFFSTPMYGQDYYIKNDRLASKSRQEGFIDRTEYTRLKNGAEELIVLEGAKATLYQNFDGDNTVDRIRIEKAAGIGFYVDDILIREKDYKTHEKTFDSADKLLLEERTKF
jgi:hypothetical protein